MNKELIEKITKELTEKKARLEQELSGFASKDPSVKGDWDTKYPRVPEGDLEDAASEVEEYSTNINIEFALEKQLLEVNGALERIAKNQYGVCINCKEEIAEERLLAIPEAAHCTKCTQSQ